MAIPAGRAAALTELLLPEGKAHLPEEEAQLKELFFRLLEAGRSSPEFLALYEEFHSRIGALLEAR